MKGEIYITYYCYECGAKMEKADEEVLVCPACHHSVDIEDYDSEEEIYSYSSYENDDMPECCVACGGPYPNCMTSCKIFDD